MIHSFMVIIVIHKSQAVSGIHIIETHFSCYLTDKEFKVTRLNEFFKVTRSQVSVNTLLCSKLLAPLVLTQNYQREDFYTLKIKIINLTLYFLLSNLSQFTQTFSYSKSSFRVICPFTHNSSSQY